MTDDPKKGPTGGPRSAHAHKPHFGRKHAEGPRDPRAHAMRREPSMDDVVDADFVTLPGEHVPGDPRAAKADLSAMVPGAAAQSHAQSHKTPRATRYHDEPAGMALFSDKPERASAKRDNRPAFYGFSAVLVALSFWASGGHALFAARHGGTAASSLLLTDTAWQALDGEGLAVSAVLLNTGSTAVSAPPVSIRIRMADGRALTYRIGTGGARIAAGSTMPLSARFDLTTTASTALTEAAAPPALDKTATAIDTVDLTLASD
jgi:hypothetical protein